jgi:hypothetical protein
MATRELYLEMRSQLLTLTEELFNDLKTKEGPKSQTDGEPVLNFELFKQWLNMYPFIRLQVRESLMPRLWSLSSGYAVNPLRTEKYKSLQSIGTIQN